MPKDLISIVVPVYGDKKLIKMLYNRLKEALSKIDVDYEFIFVNDCCPYGSGEEILKLAQVDTKIKFIDLSRNFGQHVAIKAGLDHAKGDWVVVMDCDLQDNPDDIPRFYQKAKDEGYDIVFGERTNRNDSFFKILLSKCFEFATKRITDSYYNKNIGNFSIISKRVVNEIKKIDGKYFVYGNTLHWMGFNVGFINVNKEIRAVGESNYTFYKGLILALNSLTLNSNKPLVFAAYCAFIMFVLCLTFVMKLMVEYIFYYKPLAGWTSIMVSIFFIGGLLFAYLGILGVYIGKINREVKGTPLYTIKHKVNL